MNWASGQYLPQDFHEVITPLGTPRSVYPCFADIPIFFCMGELNGNKIHGPMSWACFIVGETFGRSELMPITQCWANDKTGIWCGDQFNRWFVYRYGTAETAMLAWDYDPFLAYVNWCQGIAPANEQRIDGWLSLRRDHAEYLLTEQAPDFLNEFKGQFVKESFDDR